MLIGQISPNSVVLEFGPANGRMTRYLKENLNCKVYAVEKNKIAAKDASRFTERIIIGDIEDYKWKETFSGILFDYIIFADVLEHLYYPEKVLYEAASFLSLNGSILISIPNIAHNAIILNLLKGEFQYKSTGLLDDTHIRFFTKSTFNALVKRCGLNVSYETGIFIHPEDSEFNVSYDEFPPYVAEYIKNLNCGEVYQLIYNLKRKPVSFLDSDFSDTYNSFIQLFINEGSGFFEEISIRLPVGQTTKTQKFIFDLSDKPNIQSLRLDPLNDSCVIEIKKISLIKKDSELDAFQKIRSNAIITYAQIYYFDINDPQIYLDFTKDELNETQLLNVELSYIYTGKAAMRACLYYMRVKIDDIVREKKYYHNSLNNIYLR